MSARLHGHALWGEGAPHKDNGIRIWHMPAKGRGKCECGDLSEVLETNADRKRWHRAHKDEVRAEMAAEADRRQRTFELSDDQLCAVRELLALVHYDDLAASWLGLLPDAFKPRRFR